jgi:hypothetical protein
MVIDHSLLLEVALLCLLQSFIWFEFRSVDDAAYQDSSFIASKNPLLPISMMKDNESRFGTTKCQVLL